MAKVEFKNGNKLLTLETCGGKVWEQEPRRRLYFHINCTGWNRHPVNSFYRVEAGETRDHTFEVNGKTYAFEFGHDANSNTKREAVLEALIELAEQIEESEDA